jgi:hypothetical protein
MQVPRVERAIDTYVEPNGRQALWTEILPHALSMAAQCDGGQGLLRVASPDDRVMRMQQAFARREYDVVRSHFRQMERTRRADRPGDVSIDYTFQEAWLLAAIGDTAAATRRLNTMLVAFTTLGDYVVEHVPQAAAVGRALLLRNALPATGDGAGGRGQARASLGALWRNADPPLKRLLVP